MSFSSWLNSGKAPILIDVIRIVAGAFLVYKGVIFALDFESFQLNIQSVGWHFIGAHLAIVVIFVHTVCGSLMALGAASKWMALLNLPIIIGAVLFNFEKLQSSSNYLELEITIGLLVCLALVLYFGSGRISLDQIRRLRGETGTI